MKCTIFCNIDDRRCLEQEQKHLKVRALRKKKNNFKCLKQKSAYCCLKITAFNIMIRYDYEENLKKFKEQRVLIMNEQRKYFTQSL